MTFLQAKVTAVCSALTFMEAAFRSGLLFSLPPPGGAIVGGAIFFFRCCSGLVRRDTRSAMMSKKAVGFFWPPDLRFAKRDPFRFPRSSDNA